MDPKFSFAGLAKTLNLPERAHDVTQWESQEQYF